MQKTTPFTPRFPLGDTLVTIGVNALIEAGKLAPEPLLTQHQSGNWGDICAQDKQLNEESLIHGGRLLSAYQLGDGTKVWIITEADRSSTTILLPEEY